jgi:hypothetical protein
MRNVAIMAHASRSRAIAYWVTTGLIAAEFAVGGVWDLLGVPYVLTILAHLGYPSYFAVFMGLWKYRAQWCCFSRVFRDSKNGSTLA